MHPRTNRVTQRKLRASLDCVGRPCLGKKKNEDNNQVTVQRSDRSNKRRGPHRHQLGRKMCARDCKPTVALGRLRPTGEEPFPPDPCTLP